MKAIINHNNFVKLEDVETPQIDAVNNVLIKVKLAAICRTDLYVAEGIIPSNEGIILGHEFYGEVVHVFNNVQNVSVGDFVSINPTIFGENRDKMCGVDVDGAFAEYIKVPEYLVYKLPESLRPEYGVFTEPAAASLAVLNTGFDKSLKVCVYGKNRIADLTYKILKVYGYEDVCVFEESGELSENSFDVIIETFAESLHFAKIIRGLKKGGIFILKSRQYKPVEICVNDLVKKDIKIIAVNYGDFAEAVKLLSSGKLDIDNLIGETYPLEEFETAFCAAKEREAKKIFLGI